MPNSARLRRGFNITPQDRCNSLRRTQTIWLKGRLHRARWRSSQKSTTPFQERLRDNFIKASWRVRRPPTNHLKLSAGQRGPTKRKKLHDVCLYTSVLFLEGHETIWTGHHPKSTKPTTARNLNKSGTRSIHHSKCAFQRKNARKQKQRQLRKVGRAGNGTINYLCHEKTKVQNLHNPRHDTHNHSRGSTHNFPSSVRYETHRPTPCTAVATVVVDVRMSGSAGGSGFVVNKSGRRGNCWTHNTQTHAPNAHPCIYILYIYTMPKKDKNKSAQFSRNTQQQQPASRSMRDATTTRRLLGGSA